jgi:rfaE bifunctional protein kinase chain/domain
MISFKTERLLEILQSFQQKHILVIGDIVADEYLFGKPARIAREAPVLLLEIFQEDFIPGGASNVAVNARTLGGEVYLAGIVGNDPTGIRLRQEIRERGMHDEGLLTDPSNRTTTKTRVIASSSQMVQQHVVRLDRVNTSDIQYEYKQALITYIEKILPRIDGVIISDYENGVISQDILDACLPQAQELGKIIVVDSHGSFSRFQGVTALTPNQPEAEREAGLVITNDAELAEVGARLLDHCHAKSVLLTRGSDGMSLFTANEEPVHIPVFRFPSAGEIVDPNGAGDTVAATFTLALCAGATYAEAAYLANVAAARVVRKLGCASNTITDLKELIV